MYKLFSEKEKGYLSIIRSSEYHADAVLKLKKRPIEIFNDDLDMCLKNRDNTKGSFDIKKTKEEILEEARSKAAEQGFEQGYQEGIKKALSDVEAQLKTMAKIKDEVLDLKKKSIKESEREIAKLGLLIAKKIIRKTIEEKQDIVVNCINFALKSVSQIDELVVRLNPDDYKMITDKKSKASASINRFKEIRFVEDRRVEKGGCIIETQNGDIDARPSSQLKIANRIINKTIDESAEDE